MKGEHFKQGAQNIEYGVRGAQFSFIKSAVTPGVCTRNVLLCWDLWRRDVMLPSTVRWAGWDQDAVRGLGEKARVFNLLTARKGQLSIDLI